MRGEKKHEPAAVSRLILGHTDPFLDAVLSSEVVDMDSEADKDAAAIEASRSEAPPISSLDRSARIEEARPSGNEPQ